MGLFRRAQAQGNGASSKTAGELGDGTERAGSETSGSFGERWRRSFGGRRRSSSSIGVCDDAAAAGGRGPEAEGGAAKAGDPSPGGRPSDASDLLAEADHEGSAILLRRPDQISISYRDGAAADGGVVLSGLKLSNAERGVVRIDGVNQNPRAPPGVNPCALLEGSHQSLTYLDAGDVVEYACGVDCREGRSNASVVSLDLKGGAGASDAAAAPAEARRGDNIQVALDQSRRDATGELLEKVRALRECEECGCDATVCVSTTKSLKDPVRLCQAVVLFSKEYATEELSNMQKDAAEKDGDEAAGRFDFGMTFARRDDRLVVESISKDERSWFGSGGCAIREGDVVVGINEYISSTWSPPDAASFVRDVLRHPDVSQLSVTTVAPPRPGGSRWGKIRRAAVATGGGTLVAAGAVLMATPLHPVGHAMAIGGVGVLGTEFEAPRRVVNGARERFRERRRSWSERRRSRRESEGGEGPPGEGGEKPPDERGENPPGERGEGGGTDGGDPA